MADNFRVLVSFGILVTLGILIVGCSGSSQGNVVSAKPAAVIVKAPAPAAKPGPGRVAVEHGQDEDVSKVDKFPKVTTVENLLATRDKGTSGLDLAKYHNRRVAPFETSTYEVTGTIKSIKHEKDGDYYFVLKGETGKEAIIEVPDPKLCSGSPLLPEITAAREALEKRYHPTDKVKEVNESITVDGVGFLGSRRKKGTGDFGSSVRLMPGTGIKFPS